MQNYVKQEQLRKTRSDSEQEAIANKERQRTRSDSEQGAIANKKRQRTGRANKERQRTGRSNRGDGEQEDLTRINSKTISRSDNEK